jgi:hypothetical protein
MKMLRPLVKRLPHPLLCRLYHHTRLREESGRTTRAANAAGLPLLETLDLPVQRASDTLFILGSAWSINDIPEERWEVIRRCDSVGMNFWLAHPFVPRFFQFEDIAYDQQPKMYDAFLKLADLRAEAYADTIKIATEVNSTRGRQTLFELPDAMKRNLYVGFSMPVAARSEEELRSGIRFIHSIGAFSRCRTRWLFKYGGSVTAMMTLGVLMGYRRMILCGVDLNLQEYFYQDRVRYPDYADWEFALRNEMHLTTRRLPWLIPAQAVVRIFKEMVLDPEGIELLVESPASTLYPAVPLASQALFDELGRRGKQTGALGVI